MKANLPFLWNVIWVTKFNKDAFKNRTSVKLCVCRNKKKLLLQTCHVTKTSIISDIESMNVGLFARVMKCKLCRNIDKFSLNRRVRAKTNWLGIRIMCPSGATFLSADCCFSELAL